MGGVRDAFLTLLRAGLWGRNPMEEGFPRLGDEEWEQVFRMSVRQTVSGIVFDGICRLPDGFQPSQGGFAKWVAAADRIERNNARMNAALKGLVKLFTDNGLQPALQKGQGVAELYPAPLHRECGDIDFYFPERPDSGRSPSLSKRLAMNDKSVELVKSQGIDVELMPDGSQSYEWQGIEVEQHPTIVDLCSPTARKWIKELDEEPGYVPSDLADGLLVPSPELNALLLNTHILKHALGKGIGLRQMCDLAMQYHRICADGRKAECGGRIFSLYRKAGILKWSRLLHSFLVGVIGLPEEELPYSEKVVSYRPLFRIVEDGGNFGQFRGKGPEGSGHFDRLSDRKGAEGSRGHNCSAASEGSKERNGASGKSAGKRKLETAGMFLGRAGFSLRFAPREAFWTFWELVKGQFRK